MLEMMVFAITLVVANLVSTLILLKVMMSPRFWKKYFKDMMDMVNEMTYGDLED